MLQWRTLQRSLNTVQVFFFPYFWIGGGLKKKAKKLGRIFQIGNPGCQPLPDLKTVTAATTKSEPGKCVCVHVCACVCMCICVCMCARIGAARRGVAISVGEEGEVVASLALALASPHPSGDPRGARNQGG